MLFALVVCGGCGDTPGGSATQTRLASLGAPTFGENTSYEPTEQYALLSVAFEEPPPCPPGVGVAAGNQHTCDIQPDGSLRC